MPTTTATIQADNTATPRTITTTQPSPMSTIPPSPTPLSTPTPASSFSTLPVEQRCDLDAVEVNSETELAAGLIMFGNWGELRTDAILGSNGLGEPMFFLPTDGYLFDTSPDRDAFAYYTLERNGDLWSLEITIIDTTLMGPIIQNQFDAVEFSPSSQVHWINEEQLVVALTNYDELYRWLVWYPFEDRQETIAIELEGIGDALERYHTSVSYDPFLELMIYPCQYCPPDEYRVKDVNTGNTLWTIDLGPNLDDSYLGYPYWSADGQYVAISGHQWGEDNAVWVFSRDGEQLYKIQGGGFTMSWSPNNRFLAFAHKNSTIGEDTNSTLTLLDVVDKQLIDLCIDPGWGGPYWSPDGTELAYTLHVSEVDNPGTLINIVDIYSGDLIQLSSKDENYRIEGWIDVSQDTP
ncbi:MAG: hypothetical protein V9E94_10525 [Microthrixaceae bacterium]